MAKRKVKYRRRRGFGGLFSNAMLKSALVGLGVGSAVQLAQQRGIAIPVDPKIIAGIGGFMLGGPVGAIAGFIGTAGGQVVSGVAGGQEYV